MFILNRKIKRFSACAVFTLSLIAGCFSAHCYEADEILSAQEIPAENQDILPESTPAEDPFRLAVEQSDDIPAAVSDKNAAADFELDQTTVSGVAGQIASIEIRASNGNRTISGSTKGKAKVTLKYGKKTYKTTADSKGQFSFKNLPLCRIGTKYTITFSWEGVSYKISDTISANLYIAIAKNHLLYNTNTLKVSAKDVHEGDIIQVKIGKKTYEKTVAKDQTTYNCTFKVDKSPAGTKIIIRHINKFKQVLYTYNSMVYLTEKIYTGYTMKQVLLCPGWSNIRKKTVSGNYETWWYDFDDSGINESYLTFKDGKLWGWST